MLQTNKLKRSRGTVAEELSILNVEQLIFTWKSEHLVLALFASSASTICCSCKKCNQPLIRKKENKYKLRKVL